MSPEGLNIACRKLAMSAESRTSVVRNRSGGMVERRGNRARCSSMW
jgi:hypothetical protein